MGKAEDEDIWSAIMQEARKTDGDAERGTLLVLGNTNSGKTALLSRMQGEPIPSPLPKGIGMSYGYIDVLEEGNEDIVGNLDVWILEGETAQEDLLGFGMNEQALKNCMAMICLDFSQPWHLVSTLERWLGVLRDCVVNARAKIPELNLEEQQVRFWQSYIEPSEGAPTHHKKRKRSPIVINDQENMAPLENGILKNNLGIPIVVVCCKSDSVVMLEKTYDYKAPQFDYIQLYLRSICLSYGAALIYTSAKKDINTDVLMEYIEHRLFNMEFRHRASILENDAIFIPAGCDSEARIKTDQKTQNVAASLDETYSSVVKTPFQAKRPVPPANILYEDDQTFLGKNKILLDKDDAEGGISHASWRSNSPSLNSFLAPYPVTPSQSAPSSPYAGSTPSALHLTPHTPIRSDASASTDISNSPLLGSGVKKPSRPVESDSPFMSPGAKDKHVLATFFDALMKSKDSNKRLDTSASPGAKTQGLFVSPQARQEVEKELERLKRAVKK